MGRQPAQRTEDAPEHLKVLLLRAAVSRRARRGRAVRGKRIVTVVGTRDLGCHIDALAEQVHQQVLPRRGHD